AGITAHANVPTLEAAQALILSDLRNVEPLSAADGGLPASRYYTFEGISRDSANSSLYTYITNVFDYRYWNDTHWNCWGYYGSTPVPESFPDLPAYIKARENSLDPQRCVVFVDVHYTSGLYAD